MPKKTPAPAMKPHTGKIQFIASPKTSKHKTKPQKKAEKKHGNPAVACCHSWETPSDNSVDIVPTYLRREHQELTAALLWLAKKESKK
jgi:hypothetical protein